MIIFYNKKTKNIVGHISGRIHHSMIKNEVSIKLSGYKDEDIGKYVVPFKPVYKIVKKPIMGLDSPCPRTGKAEKIIVGYEDKEIIEKYVPDVPFADEIYNLERNSKEIYGRKLRIEEGKIMGFKK